MVVVQVIWGAFWVELEIKNLFFIFIYSLPSVVVAAIDYYHR